MVEGITTIAFFLFPGLTLGRIFRVNTSLPAVIGMSLAYWIAGFWMSSVFPVPLHLLVSFSLVVSIVLLAVDFIQRPAAYNRGNFSVMVRDTAVYALLAAPIVIRSWGQIAPTGHDMSMHAYLAAAIRMADGFIRTLSPLVPIGRFGVYPIGFPTLIAGLSSVSHLPIRESAVIITGATYWLFSASLFVLLRRYYAFPVSILTVLIASWTNTVPTNIIVWGANPTVLSLDFVILALISATDRHRYTVFRTAAFLYTAALTHFMIPVALLYAAVPAVPYIFYAVRRHRISIRWTEFFLLGILVMPFIVNLAGYRFTASETVLRYVAGLQRTDLGISATEGWSRVAASAISFIFSSFSGRVLLLYGISLLILSLRRPAHLLAHCLFWTVMFLMVVNSRYWLLPLSPLLYPDRIIILGLIPLAVGIASGISSAWHWAYREFIVPSPKNAILFSLIAITSLSVWLFPDTRIIYRRFIATRQEDVVTRDDLAVFAWIAANTAPTDTIMNNYNDAGIWIPAIAKRPITRYHTNPIDSDLINSSTSQPTYAYTGAKTLTRNGTDPVEQERIIRPERFIEVYRSGNAALYRLVPVR